MSKFSFSSPSTSLKLIKAGVILLMILILLCVTSFDKVEANSSGNINEKEAIPIEKFQYDDENIITEVTLWYIVVTKDVNGTVIYYCVCREIRLIVDVDDEDSIAFVGP